MSDDLIKRLADAANPSQNGGGGGSWERDKTLLTEAAAALAEAQAEIALLREYYDAIEAFNDTPWKRDVGEMADRVNKARAALSAGKGDA